MKRELLEALLELTKKQAEALKEQDIDTFHRLMQQKQEKIDAIEALHEAQPELRMEKHEALLKEMIDLDAENVAEYKRQFEEVKTKLSEIRNRKRMNNYYNNPYDISQEEGIFFDKK